MAHPLPVVAAIQLTHAAAQVLADDAGVDILHIKGPAVHPSLQPTPAPDSDDLPYRRSSSDADIWVRPGHLPAMVQALTGHGWKVAYHFEDGSPFRHAMTLGHGHFAPLDVHRRFPGVGLPPDEAFDVLWRDREVTDIGGVPCTVPSRTAQRLILVLHAARSGQPADVDTSYHRATHEERAAVDRLAVALQAEVALAAGTGRLEDYRHRREYRMWKAIQDGERSRPRLWYARVMAEPTWSRRVETGFALVAPKRDRLEVRLGRPPTWADQARALASTAGRAVRDIGAMATSRLRDRA